MANAAATVANPKAIQVHDCEGRLFPIRRRLAERLQNQPLKGSDRFQPQKQIETHDRRQQGHERLGTGLGDEPGIEHVPPRPALTVLRRDAKDLELLLRRNAVPRPSAG